MDYQTLKTIVENKGHVFFDDGNYDLNLIGNRVSLVYDDYFHDIFYCAYKDASGAGQVLQLPFSTLPGTYWLAHPPTVEGIKGCAVIQPGQYRGVYQFVDSYTGWLNYPYLQQVGLMNYWRDPGTSLNVDEMIPALQRDYGTNFHRGSNVGVSGQPNWYWWEGCQICEEVHLKQLLPLLRLSIPIWSNSFTYTLMEAADFIIASKPEIPPIDSALPGDITVDA